MYFGYQGLTRAQEFPEFSTLVCVFNKLAYIHLLGHKPVSIIMLYLRIPHYCWLWLVTHATKVQIAIRYQCHCTNTRLMHFHHFFLSLPIVLLCFTVLIISINVTILWWPSIYINRNVTCKLEEQTFIDFFFLPFPSLPSYFAISFHF